MSQMSAKQGKRLAFGLFFLLVATVFSARAFNSQQSSSVNAITDSEKANMKECAQCHQKLDDQSVALFSKSVHAKMGFACDTCHGGNPKAKEKATAHEFSFGGNPTDAEKLALCGSCHAPQLAAFKASLHWPSRSNAPRMTCVECHGAHAVGSPFRDFSFALYCANCHGLEYLPALPAEFQKLLAAVDEEKESFGKLESKGRKPSAQLLSIRKQVRQAVAEIVHATNLRGGLESLPQIFKLNNEFKAIAEREQK